MSLLSGVGLVAACAGCFAGDRPSPVAGSSQQHNWPAGGLAIPVDHVQLSALRDTFDEGRPGHPHEAIDIPAHRGTKVLAVDDGKVVKLFASVPGGLTVYQFDPQGHLAYYYAHLDRYADTLREGMTIHRCDVIGYVGTTGNAPANAPHLHFATFILGANKRWWQGTAINPFPALRTTCD